MSKWCIFAINSTGGKNYMSVPNKTQEVSKILFE